MYKKIILSFWLCLAVSGQAAVLKGWTQQTDEYPVTRGMERFAEQVRIKSSGVYEGKVYANAVLGDQNKALKMLDSGEIDFAVLNITPLSKAVPHMEVLSLPFLFRNSRHQLGFMDGEIGKQLEGELLAKGFVVLGWFDGGGRSFYTRNKPMRYASDFEGERFRVADNKLFKDMISALGATPVVLPYKEINAGFEAGKIDGAENNLPSFEAEQHFKYARYFSFSNHIVLPEALVVSIPLWKKLSPKEQAFFREAGREAAIFQRELFAKRIEASRIKLQKAGIKFFELKDAGPFISRMRNIYRPYTEDNVTNNMVIHIMTTPYK